MSFLIFLSHCILDKNFVQQSMKQNFCQTQIGFQKKSIKNSVKSIMIFNSSATQFNHEHLRLSIVPTGRPVWTDNNPIAEMNFSVELYNKQFNRVDGIELLGVFTIRPLSSLYDKFLYFYELFFLTVTCRSEQQRGICLTLLFLGIYVLILIMPIISPITLAISGFFFIYYLIGVAVYIINHCVRLKGHEYTENMVPASRAPAFDAMNEFFDIQAEYVRQFYYASQYSQFYASMVQSGKLKFMAYKDSLLKNVVHYIISPKTICFHISFMILAIIGFVISTKAFPQFYPALKK